MSVSRASKVRLLCAESGHWWSDSPWRAEKDKNGSTVYRRTQRCERTGCQRKRTKKISPKTYNTIGQYQYSGDQQKLGRVYRVELYREQVRRQ